MSLRGKPIEIKPCILIYGKPYISLVQAAKVLAENVGNQYSQREFNKAWKSGNRPDHMRISAVPPGRSSRQTSILQARSTR